MHDVPERRTPGLGLAALATMAGAVLLLTALLISNAGHSGSPSPATAPIVAVTVLTTHTSQPAEQTTTLAPTSAPADTPVPPTTTPRVTSYTVVERDTLWDIARRFGLTVDELIGANPGINPNLIRPGATLRIPAPGEIDVSKVVKATTAPPQAQSQAQRAQQALPRAARVSATGGNLRLRQSPSTSGRIITRLPALTPLTVLDRSADGVWLRVRLNDGRTGWVMSRYVDL